MNRSDLPATCHHCTAPPTVQWMRRATDAEAAAQKRVIEQMVGHQVDGAYIQARYGEPREAVVACEAHRLGLDVEALLHLADCGGYGACHCTSPNDGQE